MALTVLITGFGPFPGAADNPTGRLVRRLARLKLPELAGIRLVPHVFTTAYAAVERDLPDLIAHHRPDAILMFGLAARRRHLTVETRARNVVSTRFPDAGGHIPPSGLLAQDGPAARRFADWCRSLPTRLAAGGFAARLSRDAGAYVCNYLCWRTLETIGSSGAVSAFVHVPRVVPTHGGRGRRRVLTADDLVCAGTVILLYLTKEARRRLRSASRPFERPKASATEAPGSTPCQMTRR